MSGVLVVAETRRGELREVSLELLAAGLEIGGARGWPVTVAVVDPDPSAHVTGLGRDGVEETVVASVPFPSVDAWTMQRALGALLEDVEPSLILAGHTADGQGFAPGLAARHGLGFASNVTSVAWTEDGAMAQRGVYGDRLLQSVAVAGPVALVMLRPGAYAPTCAARADVATRALEVDFPADEHPTEHLGFVDPEPGDVDIAKASFLLSIGRGVEDEGGVEDIRELADALGATLSVSRPLVDAGWAPSSRQVGQSGKTVRPKVYLAMGISGAVQHLAGIREAETVIAVNTDPRAPIFSVAQYGAVADLFDVAEALPQHFD